MQRMGCQGWWAAALLCGLTGCDLKTDFAEGGDVEKSTPPDVTILAPAPSSLWDPGEVFRVEATVTDDRTAPEEIVVAVRSSVEGELVSSGSPDSSGHYEATVALGSGDHTLIVTAKDTDSNSGDDSIGLVVNARPSAPEIEINPEAPFEGAPLTADIVVRSSDPEGDPLIYRYAWSVVAVDETDFEELADQTDPTLPSEITLRGQKWMVEVTPEDVYGQGPSATAQVMVGNQLPQITALYLQPEEPRTLDPLEAVVMGWYDADGDPEAYVFTWTVNGEVVADVSDSTLDSSLTTRHDEISVEAVPWDGYGYGDALSAGPVTVENSPPSISGVDLSPTSPSTLDDLSVFTYGWVDDDEDPEQLRYQWFVNGAEHTGVTDAVFPATSTHSGDEIFARVTPYDDYDNGEPLETSTVIIDNSAPSITGVDLDPSNPNTTDDITAVVTGWTDVDDDPERYRYRWFVNGSESPFVTGAVFPSERTDKGNQIQVEVTPYDDSLDGTPMLSPTVIVENSLPSITGVVLSPSSPNTADDITAVVTGWSDLDEDAESYVYDWTINGAMHPTAGDTFSSADTVHGDRVQVTVTPTDGEEDGEPITADLVTVVNTPPEIAGVMITPAHPVSTDTLVCSWGGYSDLDDDPDASTVEWAVNGVVAGTDTTLAGAFTSGDTITCTVTAHDGLDPGTVLSDTVTVDNTRPRIVSVEITPDPATATDTLTCSWSGFWDPDGHADVSRVQWTVNGADAGTETTLSGGFVHGDTVTCQVTPSDGLEDGDSLSSSIEISNSPPSILTVEITSDATTEAVVVGNVLTCSWYGFSDSDGESDLSSLEWQVNGVSAGTTTTLSSGFAGGDHVTCTVTPYDGTDAGTPVTSDTLTIENTPPVLAAAYLSPDPAYETDTMVCTPGTTTDADGTTSFTYGIVWFVGDSIVPDETTTTLSSDHFFRSQTVHCVVTPHDGTDSGVEAISNVVTIQNSRPEITDLVVEPDEVYTNDTITATVSASDGDGDTIFLEYSWTVDGDVVLSGPTADALSGTSDFDKHASVQVAVTPSDGLDYGATVVSDPIIVLNSIPESPIIEIDPSVAEPEDDLECQIAVDSSDADEDDIDYDYEWYLDGLLTSHTSSMVPASATAHGDRWECEVTPFDGDDVGLPGLDSVVVNDLTDPDPPVIDDDVNFTNNPDQTLEGDCEPACALTMVCDDDSGTTTLTTTCDSVGRFSLDVTLADADVTECYATCTDEAGNTSGASDVVSIEVCATIDEYEATEGYGDEPSDVIDEWDALYDDASDTVEILANVLDEDEDDWYVVSAIDDVSEDLAAGYDAFDFHVEMTSGTSDYRFVVHKGGTGSGDAECDETTGYTEYNWYNEDVGEGAHAIPSDTRSCADSTSTLYNECADDSDYFYIHVFRLGTSTPSCESYQLDITNGL